MVKRLKTAALAVVVGLATLGALNAAAAVTVTGSGTWGTNAPATPYNAPNTTFSFSFSLPNPYTFTSPGGVTTIPATELSGFTYSLGGSVLPTTIASDFSNCSASLQLCAVELFPSTEGGGLNLVFGDFSVDLFEVNSKSLGDQGVLTFGNYSYFPNINGVTGTDGQLNEGSGSTFGTVVPEPATWAMLGFGIFGAGAMGRLARRQRSLVAAV